jgi:hypothetical protein
MCVLTLVLFFMSSRRAIVAYEDVGRAKLNRSAKNCPSLGSSGTWPVFAAGAIRSKSVSVKSTLGSEYLAKLKSTLSGLTNNRLYAPGV